MSHTPGPWEYIGFKEGEPQNGWAVRLPHHEGSRVKYLKDARYIRCEGWGGEEADANARLVAAAPDLLNAALAVLTFCRPTRKYASEVEAFERLRAATAKAKGTK